MKQLSIQREFKLMLAKFEALGCLRGIKISDIQREEGDSTPPKIIFLGGGMGAGKSTVVRTLSRTPFMQKYGANMVFVEADAFKMKDPVFNALAN
eukprot:CAMPEP_0174268442 /NCGR_PEP_ID=MMETSP0439-20130205/37491_1 /TAXON_ID=0 /ORGANISM="Stereomyxa ramosa, Strain Chinc5" /LENGTH=94 /DNA_ID=CAMNT_0015356621 /DNA_START=63 /DNA_END=344 /DNA_ORIENTATION=+